MLNRLGVFLLLAASVVPLRAQQDGPIKMTPELPLTFPVVLSGQDVTVKYPILINRTTILKPGMVLRTLYVLNINSDDSTDLVAAHRGNMEQAYSRDTQKPDEAKLPPELAHQIEGFRRTVWQVPTNFELALAQLPTDSLHLIYSTTVTNQHQNLVDEKFNFFDGMFVGLPNGKVTVLAVENGSKSDQAGIKAGDEVESIGGLPTRDDLATFTVVYAAAKKDAKDNNAATYPMAVRSKGELHTVNVLMPPTIKSGLMNGF